MSAAGDHDAAARERSALFVATLTSFMGPFMISSVNVALPSIQAELGMNAVQLSWIPTAYLLAMAMVLVPAGRVADIHGRKRIFIAGLVVYTIASTLAALVPTTAWLIALRVGQGIGAAMFVTTGMAIVTSVFPPQRRGRAIGIYVAAVYIGLSVGPFAGGLLVQHVGWRSLFALMLPLGAVSVGVTLRFLKGEWAEARGEPLDIVGSLIYAGAIFALVYGGTALPSAAGALLALGGFVGLVLFARRQARIAHPVFDVSLFRTNRVFAFSSLAALINYAATFAITFMLSLFLQYIKGLPPQTAGLVLVAQPAVMALFSPLAGRWADRIQPRWIASAGMLLTTLGLVGLLFLHPDVAIGRIVVNLALLGLGFALFSSPNMSAIMGSVAKHQYGIASGATATMRLLGQMISMAVAAVVLAITIGQAAIAPANYPQLLSSLKILLAIFAGMCILGIYFSMARGEIGK